MTALAAFLGLHLLFVQTVPVQGRLDSLLHDIDPTLSVQEEARAIYMVGISMKAPGDFPVALAAYHRARGLYESINDSIGIAECYNAEATIYRRQHRDKLALETFSKATTINQRIGNYMGLLKNYGNMGNYYSINNQFDKALEHFRLAEKLLLEQIKFDNDMVRQRWLGILYTSIGNVLSDRDNTNMDLSDALNQYRKAYDIFHSVNDSINLAGALNNFGLVFEGRNELDSALYYYKQALNLRTEINDRPNQLISHFNIGSVLERLDAFDSSLYHYNLALKLNEEVNDQHHYGEILKSKLRIGIQKNDTTVLQQFESYEQWKEEWYDANKAKELARLESTLQNQQDKLRLAMMEAQAARQTAEKNTYLLLLTIVATIFVVIIAWYFQRKKQVKENHQREERERIARELHDNLGNVLGALSLHFSSLKEGIQVSNGMENKLNKVDNLIKEVHSEVRTISHTMTSGFDLLQEISDLLEKVKGNDNVELVIQAHNLNEPLPLSIQLNVLRIIQELVSNTLKHAEAREVFVQLNRINGELNVTVEDDGKGFDSNEIKEVSGIGMKNIRRRVSEIGGDFQIDSRVGRGTVAIVTVPVH